ncbi:MAG: DAK2 domain-containing protein, partial [Oscillospiraceae bacterium]|nr:DAK2 domain-containing protein [Oscillospiraceae bacterium]
MVNTISGAMFFDMVQNAAAAIEINKQEVNELNVFPVPDGDTGTNMSMTMNAGAKALRELGHAPESVAEASKVTANALLRGARGNSGVILSLLFRGISKTLKDKDEATPALLAEAFQNGVDAAYAAVMKPTEGTILTVARMAAGAAAKAAEADGADIISVLTATVKEADTALAETINQNPVLTKAGVIDSGGKGYVYILEAMTKAVHGEKITGSAVSSGKEAADFSEFNTEDITFSYCTEFIVSRENGRDPNNLRKFLDPIGDSIVVVDDEEIIKTHVHTNDPGLVLTEALKYGSLLSVKIENMREQHTSKVIESEVAAAAEPEKTNFDTPSGAALPEKRYGFAVVCPGEGTAAVFRDLGADIVISGGQTMNPSTEDILRAVDAVPAEIVFVVPNNKNIILAAEQAAQITNRLSGEESDGTVSKKIVIIPSKSVPQGVSAMLAFEYDGSADPGEEPIAQAMTDALAGTRTYSVTRAATDRTFDGIEIKEGQFIAL